MNGAPHGFECRTFRRLLEERLVGGDGPAALAPLSWNEHLFACSACRELLASEEALDSLLASLPEPVLPREVAERVIARLRAAHAHEHGLEALLERDRELDVPEALARDTLAKLASARGEARLDALLASDLVTVPHDLARRVAAGARAEAALDRVLALDRDVATPAGMSSRVLASLASERAHVHAVARRSRFALLRTRGVWFAAAAALVATLALWLARPKASASPEPQVVEDSTRSSDPSRRGVPAQLDSSTPDAQMLAALDVLEHWDLLMTNDVDVLLSTLAPADEAVLQDLDVAPPADRSNDNGPSKG